MFKKASRTKIPLKIAMTGVSGSGKTYSSLLLARGLVGEEGRIAMIDTENGSGSLYSDLTDFDVLDLAPPFDAGKFNKAIQSAIKERYDCLIIDSASHIWEGVLEYKTTLDSNGGNSYINWGKAGERYKTVINNILQSNLFTICCMRSKQDYVLEEDEKGKKVPKKVGLAPIMRDGSEYEFTCVFDLNLNHKATSTKDRTSLFDDRTPFIINKETGEELRKWRSNMNDPQPQAPVPSQLIDISINENDKRIKIISETRKRLAAAVKDMGLSKYVFEQIVKEHCGKKPRDLTVEEMDKLITTIKE